MSNKISVLIDVATTKASKALKDLKRDVELTDGTFGKLKVGAKGALEGAKNYAGEFALAAGASIAAWGVKAVGDFQAVALEAGKFSAATGIAVEDASRWIEVAGDLGVKAESVEGSFLRFNKAIADGKLDEFSADIVQAKDGSIDANASFIAVATSIGKIEDPTKRAQAAQKAFGKGYGEIAELMEMSADDLKAALAGVSNSKVIDEKELARAREFRAALDNLKDRFEDITLWVGGKLVPALVDAGEKFESVAGVIGKVDGAVDKLTGSGLVDWAGKALDVGIGLDNQMSGLGRTFDDNASAGERVFGAFESIVGVVPVLGEGVSKLGEKLFDGGKVLDEVAGAALRAAEALGADAAKAAKELAEEQEELRIKGERLADVQGRLEWGAKNLKQAFENLSTSINEDQAYLGLEDQMRAVEEAAKAAFDATAAGAEDAAAKTNDHKQAVNELKLDTIAYGEQVGLLPKDVATLLELIDNGEIAAMETRLAQLTRNRTVNLSIIAKGGAGYGPTSVPGGGIPQFADGGVMPGPRGEHNLALVAGGETILPTHKSGGGGTGATTIINNYITTAADQQSVLRVLKEWQRRGGQL